MAGRVAGKVAFVPRELTRLGHGRRRRIGACTDVAAALDAIFTN